MKTDKKVITLKNLNKNTIWNVQESELLRLLDTVEKDPETKGNARHYINIAKSAFTIEELNKKLPKIQEKYEKMGYTVAAVKLESKPMPETKDKDKEKNSKDKETEHKETAEAEQQEDDNRTLLAVRKRPLSRVSDLTYENIRHISAANLVEILGNNFGGGWDSLSQTVKDIIESGFDISTTTLPKDRLHKPGGMYEKKVEDGYEVLEIPKGGWVEAIFAKAKPEMEKLRMSFQQHSAESDDEDAELPEDTYNRADEDDDEIQEPSSFEDDDDMTEDNYRTTFSIGGDDDEDGEDMGEFSED